MYQNTREPNDKVWACSCAGGIDHVRLSFHQDEIDPDEFYIMLSSDGESWWRAIKHTWRALRYGWEDMMLTREDMRELRDEFNRLLDE